MQTIKRGCGGSWVLLFSGGGDNVNPPLRRMLEKFDRDFGLARGDWNWGRGERRVGNTEEAVEERRSGCVMVMTGCVSPRWRE
jgi:hypothetical protein